jgi:chaperonin GroEL (HSP60 family)
VDPWSTGIVDSLSVVQAALETSVSMARLALSAEVLVRRKNAPRAVAP